MQRNINTPRTFEEALERVRVMMEIAVGFRGFKIREEITQQIQTAAELRRNGKIKEPTSLLLEAADGITRTLSVFFKNSPGHFERTITWLRNTKAEENVLAPVLEAHEKLSGLAAIDLDGDFAGALRVYNAMHETLANAKERHQECLRLRKEAEIERQRQEHIRKSREDADKILALLPKPTIA